MNQCEHDGCTCDVAAGQRFCSEACRQGRESAGGCGCGHPDCGGQEAG